QDKPFFIAPCGHPVADAEDVVFPTTNGLNLRGCYFKTDQPRKGVILFGLEFGSNRWACEGYCDFLVKAGYDVFAFDVRNQGDSDAHPGYDPLQWVSDFEVQDYLAALQYLRSRDDADPRGVGLFGISKGGSAGLMAAAEDDFIRCFVTDGVFAAHTTMVPYMQRWAAIFCHSRLIAYSIPMWYFRIIGHKAMRIVMKQRGCTFPHLEEVIHKLAPRPLLMIHGGADNYIKPEMSQALFDRAGQPKEFWLVEGAKHNQAFQVANGAYQRRVLGFFDKHLAQQSSAAFPIEASTDGNHHTNGRAVAGSPAHKV